MNMLFTYNHQLNYDEVVRRLKYWVAMPDEQRARSTIKMLVDILEANRGNLYFE